MLSRDPRLPPLRPAQALSTRRALCRSYSSQTFGSFWSGVIFALPLLCCALFRVSSSPYSCMLLSRMLAPTKPSFHRLLCAALYLTSNRYSYYIPPNSRHWCLLLLSPLGASTIKHILATPQSRHPTWLLTHFYDITIFNKPSPHNDTDLYTPPQ